MTQLPDSIKFTFLLALAILMIFIIFIVLIIIVYKKKQVVFQKEKLIQDIKIRNQALEQELEIQKQIQQERERISHDMHDDLGAGISALKLQAEFIKQKIENTELKADIDDMLKTAGEMNLSMREMLWSLNSEKDNLGDFMQYVVLYAENFFKKTPIRVSVKRNIMFPETQMSSEIRKNLFLCAKETFNNIYKHSRAQNTEIIFSHEGDSFIMEIKDDGIGFTNENLSGNGMNNMQKRMEGLAGNFITKPSEKGTYFIFEIKV